MKTFAILASLAAALVVAAIPASAATKHHRHYVSHAARGAYASQPQIACTVVGCMPIPRGCHPEMGYTPNGTPTGFDVAVCGNTTLYGNRR
jgi:hypothetical protein